MGGAIQRLSTRGRARMGKAVDFSVLKIAAVLTEMTSDVCINPLKQLSLKFTLTLNSY